MRRALFLTAALALALSGLLPPEHVHWGNIAGHHDPTLVHRHLAGHTFTPRSRTPGLAIPHDGRFELLTTWLLGTERFAQAAPDVVISRLIVAQPDAYVGPLVEPATVRAIHDPPRSSVSFRAPPSLS